jgi:kynurenine formamidase
LNLPADLPSSPGHDAPPFKPDAPGYSRVSYRINLTNNGMVLNDDYVVFATQGSSQWDAFVHTGLDEDGVDGVFYNGLDRSALDKDGFALRGGIDKFAEVGIVGRGVLLDVARMMAGGGGEPLPLDHVITPDETRRCIREQDVTIEPGDVVCFRTGWTERFVAADVAERARILTPDPGEKLPNVPGLSSDHAGLARHQRWSAVVSDNVGIEALPLRPPPAHVTMLRNLGLPFGELFIFQAIAQACAADGRWTFLFVAVPMLIRGGSGSPGNAIAIR